MSRAKSNSAPASDDLLQQPPETPLKDAMSQIRDARDAIVAAVIAKAIADGSHQTANWLFEFGAITPAAHRSPEDQPSLLRLLLDRLQIPESPEDVIAEFSANDQAIE